MQIEDFLGFVSSQKRNLIEISDSEFVAITDAIGVYKDYIKERIGDEIKAPYWSRLQSIKKLERSIESIGVLEQLYSNNIYLHIDEIQSEIDNFLKFNSENKTNTPFKEYYLSNMI